MTVFTKSQRRENRKTILGALHSETGSNGGDSAKKRVEAYRRDPLGATTVEFGYVGGLALTRWYVDPNHPDNGRRASLWKEMLDQMEAGSVPDPDGWSGSTDVKTLQQIVEQAIAKADEEQEDDE